MKIIYWMLFFALFMYAKNLQAGFDEAMALYKTGNFVEAFPAFREVAELGDKEAQFNLGVMYYHGHGVEPNPAEAAAWLRLANEAQVPHWQGPLNTITSSLTPAQMKQAETLYQKLASRYSDAALTESVLPVIIESDTRPFSADQVTPLHMQEPEWPPGTLQNGIPGQVLIRFDLDPLGKPRNAVIADALPEGIFEMSALVATDKWTFEPGKDKSGTPIWLKNVTYQLEYQLHEGPEIGELLADQIREARNNALAGSASDQYLYAHFGHLIKIDGAPFTRSLWYAKAAIQGHAMAQYQLALRLFHGNGFVADKKKFLVWLKRSASNNHPPAQLLLADQFLQSNSLESIRQAEYWLSRAADASYAPAKVKLAWLLATTGYPEIRDGDRAMKMIDTVDFSYFDQITVNEVKAAAQAARGNFRKAIRHQKHALREAKSRHVYIQDINHRMSLYKARKAVISHTGYSGQSSVNKDKAAAQES